MKAWNTDLNDSTMADAILDRVGLHTTATISISRESIQVLHWLKDMLPTDGDKVRKKLTRLLHDPKHGKKIMSDLARGFGMLPSWMQTFLRTVPGFTPRLPPFSLQLRPR